jgi:nucleotide-binding universal stress UspA family protein
MVHPTAAAGACSVPPHGPAAAPFQRVIACLDASRFAGGVIAHAVAIAQLLGIPLTLLRVLETRPIDVDDELARDPLDWEMRRKASRQDLEQCGDAYRAARIPIETEMIEGHAAEQICHWIAHHEPGLLVLCSHGAGGRTQWRLGSTARQLCEGTRDSLLLVPAPTAEVAGVARYRRILVPLDGSLRAESVLPLAVQLAAAAQAELLLAHIVPVPELTGVGHEREDVELRERLLLRNERFACGYIDGLRRRLMPQEVAVRTVVLRGDDVRDCLARLIAEEHADMVVLSAHGQSGRCDLPYGSVAAHLVEHATAPLLIARWRPPHVHSEAESPAAPVRLPAR